MTQQQAELKARPSFEEVLEGECGVCFVPFAKVVPRRIEEGLEVLLCSRCHVHVHKCCYDFEANLTVQTDRISEFLCDRCAGPPLLPEKQHCLVCYGEDGAMKRIGDELIHVYCGLMHNDIEAVSYYPALAFKKSLHYDETAHTCELCKRRNAHEQCAEESCRRKVHVYCAKAHHVALAKESDDEPKAWNHRISTGNHGNFDLTDEVIPYELFAEEEDGSLREVAELGLDLSSVEEFKRRVHKSYLQEIRSRRKSTKKLRRGGFSFVLCPQHEAATYCSCFSKADGEEMVLCECCFEWYHHKCIKLPATDDSYVCQFCRSFYEFKRRAVEEVRGGRADYDLGKVELPLRASAMDCLWVLRAVDQRIRGGQGAKMLKELCKYPLKSSCMDLLIRQQNRSKLTSLSEECLALFLGSEQLQRALRPRPVLAVDAQGRPFVVGAHVEHNRLLRRGVQALGGLRRGQGFAAILRELDFKERALSDSYEQIIELSKVEQPYQEVAILRQKAQAYNFVQIIRKINDHEPVSHQELQDSIRKAEQVDSLPAYLARTLQEKYNTVRPILQKIGKAILSAPDNTYLLGQLVEELQAEHVLPPGEYLQLTAEKKVVQGVYLYLIKQEGSRMQEELTVGQELEELLQEPPLKPSQELVDILAAYRPVPGQPLVWPALAPLLHRYQAVALDFEVRDIAKRRFCKQEKFLAIVERAAGVDLANISEEVRGILQAWREIKGNYDAVTGLSLDDLAEYEALAESAKLAGGVIQSIENFPIRLEEEGGKAMVVLAKARRDELEQLRTLYTEAQLQKNPLTLSKLLPSLPKSNPLVKQWAALRKEQSSLQGKYTALLGRISERLEYFRTEKKLLRKEQIEKNSEKPSLGEVTELIETLKHSSVEMGKEVRELTRVINNSLEVAGRVRKYIEERGDCASAASLEELALRRKEIEEQRRRLLTVAELSLCSELVELYHLEICNRMRSSLLSPGLDLEKIGTQLKFAEEEGLMHTETYLALKEKYENKSQKSKEVSLVKGLELSLAAEASKDPSFNFAALYLYRRALILPELPEARTKNAYLDDLIDRNRALRERVSQALQQTPGKWELGEARAVYLEALKSPYTQPELARLSVEVGKAWEVVRRWRELARSFNHLHPIFLDYDLLAFTVEEIETVKREIRNNEDEIARLDHFLAAFDESNRDQLEEIIERIETSGAIRDTEICRQAEHKYIRYWTRLLQCCKTARRAVPFEKLRRLALDAYNLLQRCLRTGEEHEELKTSIYELEDYLILVKNHLKCYPTRSSNALIADSFIDLEELYLENEDEEADLADCVPLLRPFSDLAKFRVKNLQRLECRREEVSLKRSRDKLDDLPERPSARDLDPSSSSEPAPQAVSESERRKIKEIFLKNIRKNPELRRYGQCENEVKMIENQIFGEWHNDIVKYFEMSEQFERLFMKLVHCPNISGKVIKKKFEFKFIQILVANLHKIDELEGMIVSKIKEIETEKTITKIAEPLPERQAAQEREKESEAVIESIASGKVHESFKQDLKKEIKILKEGKHKKRKHHKHNRSRSRSPDAKFSSGSEKELPSYIQNEYNKEEARPEKKPEPLPLPKVSESSPLRYDPEQEELQSREAVFPRGSILKLKTCELEVAMAKRKGKADFAVEVLTEEEHRKVVGELFDPGFSRLAIKKDKNEAEIIQYIGKSKKKYKYLVCWFEAVRPDDNELLHEIAADANEKRKIFGWQNEHIKIHIMSMRQLVLIARFPAPARVTSPAAAAHLAQERVVMVVQYPEKVYEVRDLYKPFEQVERKTEEFATAVPAPEIPAPPVYDFFPKYTIPTIEPLPKTPAIAETVYEGGWGSEGTPVLPQAHIPQAHIPQAHIPQQPPLPLHQMAPPPQQAPPSGLPYKVNQIRLHFGFNSFSPILTDEDEGENNGDLASDLLNSLGDFKMMPAQPQPALQREKPPAQQQQQQQQQYQGYYGYGYQQQQTQAPPRPMPAERNWVDYRAMGQQGMAQQAQVYNPLNPMAGKYSPAPPQPQMSAQMGGQGYKNPMMERQRQSQSQMGQYYRPPSGDSYDRRYQGGYQQ